MNGEVLLVYDPTGVSCEIAMPLPEGDAWSNNE
jgi:hypothetical protein